MIRSSSCGFQPRGGKHPGIFSVATVMAKASTRETSVSTITRATTSDGKGGGKHGKGNFTGKDWVMQPRSVADQGPWQIVQTRTTTIDEIVNTPTSTRPKFDVVVVLDTSSSMKGQKMRDAIASIQDLVDNVLDTDDGVGLVTFAADVREQLPLTRKRHLTPLEECMSSIHCSGRTALWDGIFAGFSMLCRRERQQHPHPSHPYLIVLTDGQDNSSINLTKERLRDILAKPSEHGFGGLRASNFHMNCW
mmetsp:Transcript_27352/g.69198  ORF Transcript_27352/g.69198 Transcript_27352/m.69198 type:complete len:249 (+) Transcript_27352:32-778(+)